MRQLLRFFVSVLGCVFFLGAGAIEAQERVLPTGTPTIVPKKSTVTPTPRPLTETEVEARNLGVELSQIDGVTWSIVRSSWGNEAECLAAVDAHLDKSLDELTRLIRTSAVMECVHDPNTDRKRLRLTTEEARHAFLEGYHGAADALRSLRDDFAKEPAGAEVLEAARVKQSVWQDRACRELDSQRVPRSTGRPVKVPDRASSNKGSS